MDEGGLSQDTQYIPSVLGVGKLNDQYCNVVVLFIRIGKFACSAQDRLGSGFGIGILKLGDCLLKAFYPKEVFTATHRLGDAIGYKNDLIRGIKLQAATSDL